MTWFLQKLVGPLLARICSDYFANLQKTNEINQERIDNLEKAVVALEESHNEQLRQLQERLELPQKRKSSGRPFSVLAKIASLGASRAQS